MQEITAGGIPKADLPHWVLESTVFSLCTLEFKCSKKIVKGQVPAKIFLCCYTLLCWESYQHKSSQLLEEQ